MPTNSIAEIKRELILAILSLDSYNRGYEAGISGLSESVGTPLGNATVFDSMGSAVAQAVLPTRTI